VPSESTLRAHLALALLEALLGEYIILRNGVSVFLSEACVEHFTWIIVISDENDVSLEQVFPNFRYCTWLVLLRHVASFDQFFFITV
jgi:hypothetical protein